MKKKKRKIKKLKPEKKVPADWGATEEELVQTLDENLFYAWIKLRKFSVSLGPQRIYASPKAIMFSKKICFFFVRPKKAYLEIWIFLPRKIESLKSVQSAKKIPKFCNMMKVLHADQIEAPLTEWIREAYEFCA